MKLNTDVKKLQHDVVVLRDLAKSYFTEIQKLRKTIKELQCKHSSHHG